MPGGVGGLVWVPNQMTAPTRIARGASINNVFFIQVRSLVSALGYLGYFINFVDSVFCSSSSAFHQVGFMVLLE